MAELFGIVAVDPATERPPGDLLRALLAARVAASWDIVTGDSVPGAAMATVRPRAEVVNATVEAGGGRLAAIIAGGDVTGVAKHLLDSDTAVTTRRQHPAGYAVASYAGQTLVLGTDPVGTHPLFVRRLGAHVAFGSNALALAELEPRAAFDVRGIAELLVLGQLIGRRTLFEGVEALPAGARRSIGAAGDVETPFAWPHWREAEGALEERVARAWEALRASALAAPGADAGLLLSGGLDSRLILAVMRDATRPVRAYTFGEVESRDLEIAQRVARGRTTEHVVAPSVPAALERVLHQCVALTGGGVSALHFHGVELMPRMRREVVVQWNGFAGDAILGGTFAHPRYLVGGAAGVGDKLFRSLSAGRSTAVLQGVWQRRPSPELTEHPRRALEGVVAALEGRTAAETAFRVLMQERVGRLAAIGLALDRHSLPVVTPFAHGPSVALMLRMAPSDRRFSRLVRDTLRTHAPELARIPWQRTGARPDRPWPWLLATRTFGRLQSMLTGARDSALIDYAAWLTGPLAPLRRRLLESLAEHTAFDGDALRALAKKPSGATYNVSTEGTLMALGAMVELRSGRVSLSEASRSAESEPEEAGQSLP